MTPAQQQAARIEKDVAATEIGRKVQSGELATHDHIKNVVVKRQHLCGTFDAEIERTFVVSVEVTVRAGVDDGAIRDWGFNEDAVLEAVRTALDTEEKVEAAMEEQALFAEDADAAETASDWDEHSRKARQEGD